MSAGAPVFVPWHDHQGEPRFICDVMTEGLAKQLRLYGVDAAAVESKGKGSRHLVYRSALYCPLLLHCPLPLCCPLPLGCLSAPVSLSPAFCCTLPHRFPVASAIVSARPPVSIGSPLLPCCPLLCLSLPTALPLPFAFALPSPFLPALIIEPQQALPCEPTSGGFSALLKLDRRYPQFCQQCAGPTGSVQF